MSDLLSRLVAINSIVVLLVILLAGLSVKNYACYLVNSQQIVGNELVDTLNRFLWIMGILVFIIAGLFHYLTIKKNVRPITHLSKAAREIKEGKTPSKIKVNTSGELKDLVDNFNSMTETLYSVQEQREEMLRDIAHELRTPLTNINGYLEALQNGVLDGDQELFSSLLEESRRMTRIVELITELNSWNDGNYFLEKHFNQIAIQKVLTEAIVPFQLKLDNQIAHYHIELEQAEIYGNKDGLTQIFTNIIQNVVSYNTGDSLSIIGNHGNELYTITFTHTGQFIDPEKKDLIFERFYRQDESRSTKSGSAGLGLAISKSIITAHGGSIGVNTDGINHSFWIEIPLKVNSNS